MLDNFLTDTPLRTMSRGRVRFTYRVDKDRIEKYDLPGNWFDLFGGRSYRFEVTKTGKVRVTERMGDDDRHLSEIPQQLAHALLKDRELQGTLINAVATATGER